MSDESSNLTQDQIERLLSGADDTTIEYEHAPSSLTQDRGEIQKNEIQKLVSMFTVIVDSQTTHISQYFGEQLNFSNLRAVFRENNQIMAELGGLTLLQIRCDLTGEDVKGENSYLIPKEDALRLASITAKQQFTEINEDMLKAVTEVFAQMNGAEKALFESSANTELQFSSAQIEILDSSSRLRFPGGMQSVLVYFSFNPENQPPIQIYQLMKVSLAKTFLKIQANSESFGQDLFDSEQDKSKAKQTVQIRPVQYSTLESISLDEIPANIGKLIDINMQMTVELGRTKTSIRNILQWGEGSIVELTKLAGEPVDILVNGKPIARGEVMVIDENFAVRVTEIITAKGRIDAAN